ncbi:MAG: class I SAM-dependent methyltransferase [Anaerolineae bacterium]
MSDHYGQIAQAFDRAAGTYDELYQRNSIMAWMRAESLATLRAGFAPGGHLLELGCGTGEEALALSQLGYQVVATDVSPMMIEKARAKAQAIRAPGVTWQALPAGQLAELTVDYGLGAFDGAYSSFGALNCEPELGSVAVALFDLLRPGAVLICSVMNRWCMWEMLWALLHMQPRTAFRRLARGWVAAGLAGADGRLAVRTRYYGPRGFVRAMEPYFKQIAVRGLPVFLPPPYLDHLPAQYPDLLARLEALERQFGSRFPFYSLGDHFLVTMVRAGNGET